MDPVSQVLAQQTSGSAGGQGFGQFYLQGRQLGQEQQRINLSQRRLMLEEAQGQREQQKFDLLLPLQIKQQELENANAGMVAFTRLQQLRQLTQQNAALPELLDLQMRFQENPEGYGKAVLKEEYKSLVKRFPKAFVSGVGAEIKQGIEADVMIDGWANRLKSAQDKLKGTGLAIQGFNPKTGSIELMRESAAPATPAQAAALGMEPSTINASGQVTYARPRQNETFDITLPDGTKIHKGPAGGDSDLTSGTKGELQKKSLEIDNALSVLDQGLTALQQHPEAAGIVGKGLQLLEQGKGQLFPNAQIDTTITETRHKLGLAFVAIAKGLRVDSGNMSRYELNQLEQLGDLTQLEEAPQTALTKGRNIRNILIGQKLRTDHTLGKPVPDNFLQTIPDAEFVPLFRNGLLTEEEAQRLYNLKQQQKATNAR